MLLGYLNKHLFVFICEWPNKIKRSCFVFPQYQGTRGMLPRNFVPIHSFLFRWARTLKRVTPHSDPLAGGTLTSGFYFPTNALQANRERICERQLPVPFHELFFRETVPDNGLPFRLLKRGFDEAGIAVLFIVLGREVSSHVALSCLACFQRLHSFSIPASFPPQHVRQGCRVRSLALDAY